MVSVLFSHRNNRRRQILLQNLLESHELILLSRLLGAHNTIVYHFVYTITTRFLYRTYTILLSRLVRFQSVLYVDGFWLSAVSIIVLHYYYLKCIVIVLPRIVFSETMTVCGCVCVRPLTSTRYELDATSFFFYRRTKNKRKIRRNREHFQSAGRVNAISLKTRVDEKKKRIYVERPPSIGVGWHV